MKKLFTKILVLVATTFIPLTSSTNTKKNSNPITSIHKKDPIIKPRKDWNFIVYFAANNNLHRFAIQNIKQMMQVGSTNTINAIIQIDELGAKEISRYYVQKGNISPVFHDSNNAACVSGTQESLYNFIAWTLQNYPANHNCLVLWNHGSGIKDPSIWQRVLSNNRNELYAFNEENGLYEINRKLKQQEDSVEDSFTLNQTRIIELNDPIEKTFQNILHGKGFGDIKEISQKDHQRGIGFNDTFEEYLTNQDLQIVLERVNKELLNGSKIDIVCTDACLMQMAEFGSQIKNAVTYMVGSEEVSRGEGYPYEQILAPFTNGTLTPENFAKYITQSYAKFYTPIDANYTQSTLNLNLIPALEENFGQITKLLMELINSANGFAYMNIIRTIRNNSNKTIEFYDPDYIDLCKFYTSLYQGFSTANGITKDNPAVNMLKEKITQGLGIIKNAIIANTSGRNCTEVSGLSFYFPATTIHKSYPKTVFDQITQWSSFLARYHKKKSHHNEKKDDPLL